MLRCSMASDVVVVAFVVAVAWMGARNGALDDGWERDAMGGGMRWRRAAVSPRRGAVLG